MATRRRLFGGNAISVSSDALGISDAPDLEIARGGGAPARVRPYRSAVHLRPRRAYGAAKRGLDLVVALTGIAVLLPLFAVVALLIRLDSPGPLLIRQRRLGKDMRPFDMLKFRTMSVNSVALPESLVRANEASGPLFKIRRDPRITRVGRFLRRGSLDELPQLFNVVRGEMTLVGPRPPLEREIDGFDTVQRLRLRVLPGLTGLWQISGRSDLPFEEMVRLDLRYIEERSFWRDVIILARTLPCVLTGRGAY